MKKIGVKLKVLKNIKINCNFLKPIIHKMKYFKINLNFQKKIKKM